MIDITLQNFEAEVIKASLQTPVLLDVAHNPQAARILADHLASHYPGKPVRAVFSVMRDKDIHGILEPLRQRVFVENMFYTEQDVAIRWTTLQANASILGAALLSCERMFHSSVTI